MECGIDASMEYELIRVWKIIQNNIRDLECPTGFPEDSLNLTRR
jgi:hypothetical protein